MVYTAIKVIQMILKDDEILSKIALNESNPETLINSQQNGVLLCKLLIKIDPECIDTRAMNL